MNDWRKQKRIDYERYTAQNDTIIDRVSGNGNLSVVHRLDIICRARINDWGHAAFAPGELFFLVYADNPTPKQKRMVKAAIRTLVEAGLAAPESTLLCVVLDRDIITRGCGKGSWHDDCSEPDHWYCKRHYWSGAEGWHETRGHVADAGKMVDDHVCGAANMADDDQADDPGSRAWREFQRERAASGAENSSPVAPEVEESDDPWLPDTTPKQC